MNSGFIYKWIDKKKHLVYIGKHEGAPEDGYICNNSEMLDEYHKRPWDFVRTILWYSPDTNSIELTKKEKLYLSFITLEELFGGQRRVRYNRMMEVTDNTFPAVDPLKNISQVLAGKKAPGATNMEILWEATRKHENNS